MGRFMTPDWAARPTSVPYAVFGDPQSLNLYTYVRNDPVTNADADGHMCSWSSAVGTGIVCNVGDNSAPAKNQQGGQAQAQNQSQQSQLPNPAQVVFNQVKKEFSDLPLSEKNVKDLGAHNGHENIQVNGTASKDQLAQIQKTLDQNKGMFGPGSRIDIKIGDKSFSLHVEFFQSSGSGDTRNVQFQSHIDRGNPNRDVVGMGTHALVDGFRGAVFHPHDPGLDPQ
ncbi:MAG: hypothetical protein ABSA78_07395 [Candidatus Sulfotelmatobacter sp.]|jgi:hypothetical protein